MSGVPGIAQRALTYVRTKWQPDAFLTSIQMELAKQIKAVHIENYGRGSYAGSVGLFGPEWVIDSALDERGAVLADLSDRGGDVRLSTSENEAGDKDQSGSDIHVEIGGLRNDRGQVYCWLFTSGQDFPANTQSNAASTAATISNRRASCDFENEDPGSYPILVFHDEDSQQVIELNPNGSPREGVGLSNNPMISSALPGYDAAMFPYRTGTLNLTINTQYPNGLGTSSASAPAPGRLTGFAFVDSSVTGQGSRAKLPGGTRIYPPGSTITGTDGCPTTQYHTDGMIVAVIDYQGRPTAGQIGVIRHPAGGGQYVNAPYYLALDPGRTLQFLGPIFENGTYDVHLEYDYSLGQPKTDSATFVLARSCAKLADRASLHQASLFGSAVSFTSPSPTG